MRTTEPTTTPFVENYRTLPEDEETVFMEKLNTLTCDEIEQIIMTYFYEYPSFGDYNFPEFEKYGFVKEDFTEDLVLYYIQVLRERGCCIELERDCGFWEVSPFEHAVNGGYDALALFFLECGNPPWHMQQPNGGTSFKVYYFPIYVKAGNYEMVSSLVDYGLTKKELSEGLFTAIESGNSVIVRFILDSCVDNSIEKSLWLDKEELVYQNSWGGIPSLGPIDEKGFTGLTPLYHALRLNQKDIAEILVDYGADPAIGFIEYTFSAEFNTPEGFDIELDVFDLPDDYYDALVNADNWEYTAIETFTQSPLDLAKSKGHDDLVNKMLNPSECISLEKKTAALVKERWEKKEFALLAPFLGDIKDRAYCTSGRDLMRNVCYWTATDFYIKEDFNTAIAYFQRALKYTASNKKQITDPLELEIVDLSAWEKERKDDAPGYYCAYNIACAYSLLGKIEKGFRWLEIAIRMNPEVKETAKKDADLKALQEQGAEFMELTR